MNTKKSLLPVKRKKLIKILNLSVIILKLVTDLENQLKIYKRKEQE